MKLHTDEVVADLSRPTEISIRLEFDGPQPDAFGIDRARAEPYRAGDWIGDVAQGGAVNCFIASICPHGNGTHTECVGHIVHPRVAVADVLTAPFVVARVVTVAPRRLSDSGERYDAPCDPDDLVVAAADLPDDLGAEALVLRTLPNGAEKKSRSWSKTRPPYLTNDAMRKIRDAGAAHLLLDLPSVDRDDDDGELLNHRIFWDVPSGSTSLGANEASPRTITEMVWIPDSVADGRWVVGFEIPDWDLDAAPSRVRLYPLVGEAASAAR